MGHDLGIANRLRAKGLRVVELAGWQTRGSANFNPQGSVDHHTAGPPGGNAPSLNVCLYGRTGIPGPLCNVLVGRDNTCYVIAAGRANHAGRGGFKGLSGNSSVYGVERENVGVPRVEPWRNDQTETAALVHAALMEGKNSDLVCMHKEWTSRKIDAHTISGSVLRALVRVRMTPVVAPQPQPTPQPDIGINIQEVDMYIAVDGVGFFAQIGNVTIGLPVDLAGFAKLMESNKSVGLMVIPASAKDAFIQNALKQTAKATAA